MFFTNDKRCRHNLSQLANVNSMDNPTAIIKCQSNSSKNAKGIRSHFNGNLVSTSLICRNAKVCIKDRNFFPLWGLHNGACGTVKEIIFEKGNSPNHGDLPKYVIVEFPLHRGPAWDKNNPKQVPIPMCTSFCKYKCCNRTYCPLDLCFARTIHKFQGLQAGPPKDGEEEHMHHCVICDPDVKSIEATHTGLFYTALSRGTTLGDNTGLNSAVCFTGEHLTRERIQELTKCLNGHKEHIKVTKRRNFVNHLDNNTLKNRSPKTKSALSVFNFFKNTITQNKLSSIFIKHTSK